MNRQAFRGKGPKGGGRYAAMWVKASSPEKAIECARRNSFSKEFRFFGRPKPADPYELGCVTSAEAAAIVENMRKAWRAKHGTR